MRARTELPRLHVLDHVTAPAQRAFPELRSDRVPLKIVPGLSTSMMKQCRPNSERNGCRTSARCHCSETLAGGLQCRPCAPWHGRDAPVVVRRSDDLLAMQLGYLVGAVAQLRQHLVRMLPEQRGAGDLGRDAREL